MKIITVKLIRKKFPQFPNLHLYFSIVNFIFVPLSKEGSALICNIIYNDHVYSVIPNIWDPLGVPQIIKDIFLQLMKEIRHLF